MSLEIHLAADLGDLLKSKHTDLDHFDVLDSELGSLVDEGSENDVLAVTVQDGVGITICEDKGLVNFHHFKVGQQY